MEEKKDEIVQVEQATQDMIDKANIAAARQEAANKELAALLAKQERLHVERTLGGHSEAGKQEKTQEQKEIDDARKLLEGTGYEDVLFPVT